MIDNSDGFVIPLHDCLRRANRNHRCSECGRTILPREIYRHEGFVSLEDTKETFKTCRECDDRRDWLNMNCGGWVYGEVVEDFDEHVGTREEDEE